MPPRSRAEPPAGPWWVVCLCAEWCTTCGAYRATFDAVAREWPAVRFEWVDIEDEAELMGDLDVETFPTLLVAGEGSARFLGPLLPHAHVLTRLIGSLQTEPVLAGAAVDAQAQALFERVCAQRQ